MQILAWQNCHLQASGSLPFFSRVNLVIAPNSPPQRRPAPKGEGRRARPAPLTPGPVQKFPQRRAALLATTLLHSPACRRTLAARNEPIPFLEVLVLMMRS